jgi:cation diffusion facilitator family transporter
MDRTQSAINTSKFSIVSNAVLAIVKLGAGIFGNSYALIADAIESTTDILSSILVYVGIRYASKPADHNHPYGHGRLEPLITFMVVGFLIAAAILIAYQSIHNILTPHQLPALWTLWVLTAIILWKGFSYAFVIQKSEETHSTSLKADAWHHLSDAITSVAAMIGIAIALILGEGYESADDWAALIASGIITYNAYLIFRPALGEIMDEHVHHDMIESIRQSALKVEGILDTEKCLIRKSGMFYLVDLHATVDGKISVKQGHDLAHRLKDQLIQDIPQIQDVLIHIEPEGH